MHTVVRHVSICRNSSCTSGMSLKWASQSKWSQVSLGAYQSEGVQEQVQERAHSYLQLSENNSPQAPLDRKPLLPGSKVLRGMQYHTTVQVHSMDQCLHHKARVWETPALPALGVGTALLVAGAAQEGQQSVAKG